ncbi:I78 family peptidase inhibitor [Hyphomonas pacifica]|uniref:Uncharacterized protein n=1 Tax=Hyphomonas pacifica TaxID=1280941 RepID=A0A062TUU3_9PROT|nr:I78 family peptidase inhibitor [Hyphomonas pacifica]KCZ48381.1 hypothetical protein HY2_04030 [Hyphomonas pacifica]RAN31693.1 hypothetical protein HY3_03725 [Hyphomonas pacifica]
MKIRAILLAVSAALLLAACGGKNADPVADAPQVEQPPVEAVEGAPPEDAASDETVSPQMDPLDQVEDSCGMAALQAYIGQAASDIPEDELPEGARIVGPDTQVTMDYVPTRLNVLTDEDGLILSLKCG